MRAPSKSYNSGCVPFSLYKCHINLYSQHIATHIVAKVQREDGKAYGVIEGQIGWPVET